MPIYEPDHVEYAINTGHVQIVQESGGHLPAYWAYPAMGQKFPGVILAHDWWGLTGIIRRTANLFAQMGYYVIAPDLFNGRIAGSYKEALRLVESLGATSAYPRVSSALSVLEQHMHSTGKVAVVGVGMGGSLAFEAAVTRPDLEAVIAFGGFPHRYFGRFKDCYAPIFALYGARDSLIIPAAVQKLSAELQQSSHPHRVEVIDEFEHDFFVEPVTEAQRVKGRHVMREALAFLDKHLGGPARPRARQVY